MPVASSRPGAHSTAPKGHAGTVSCWQASITLASSVRSSSARPVGKKALEIQAPVGRPLMLVDKERRSGPHLDWLQG